MKNYPICFLLRVLLAVFVLAILPSYSFAAEQTLIGITATNLVLINPSNPSDVKIIGPQNLTLTHSSGYPLIGGITYNPVTGKLFGIAFAQDFSNQYLVEFDRQTGAGMIIAALGNPKVIGYFEALEYVSTLDALVASHATTPGSAIANQLGQLKTDGSFIPLVLTPLDNDYAAYDSMRDKFYTTDPNGREVVIW